MLKITIEIVPWGLIEFTRKLGEIYIANIGRNDVGETIYHYEMINMDKESKEKFSDVEGTVTFERQKGFWKLLSKVLQYGNIKIDLKEDMKDE